MSLDNALTQAMQGIPECVAAGYVDMESGMLLGVKTLDSHPQEVLDLVAAATADMFQGSTVTEVERLFRESRGNAEESNHHYFKEIIIFSDNLIHVMMRIKKYPNHVLTFVCRKSANIGMVIAKSRVSVDKVADAL